MSVRLTRIYTRTGDDGTSGLADFSRVSKTDPRLVAYADCDETNATLGMAMALSALPFPIAAVILRVQNELFDVGADLATPVVDEPPYPPLRVTQEYIDRLEADCDAFNAELPALTSFILPGGTPSGALAAPGPDGRAAGRAERVGPARGGSRWQQPAGGDVPQPALGSAVHPGAGGQPRRRRALATRRRTRRQAGPVRP